MQPMPPGAGAPGPVVTAGVSRTSGMKVAGYVLALLGGLVFGGLSATYFAWSSGSAAAAEMARHHLGDGPIAHALEAKADGQGTMAAAFGLIGVLMLAGGAALVVVGGKQGAPPPKLPFAGPTQASSFAPSSAPAGPPAAAAANLGPAAPHQGGTLQGGYGVQGGPGGTAGGEGSPPGGGFGAA